MQVQLETFLHKQWDRKGLISWLLLPASAVFLSMAASRRRKTVPVKVGVPVVVVGNIYVGGTGKTPVTIALVKDLKERGWNPGIISRGYRGKAESPVEVRLDSNPDLVGDEPLLIKKATDAPTFVCPHCSTGGSGWINFLAVLCTIFLPTFCCKIIQGHCSGKINQGIYYGNTLTLL